MTRPVDSYDKIFSNKKRILAVFAHPDDLELYAGGTVSRLTSDGKLVRSVKVTSGDMGSRLLKVTREELQKIRETEDSASMTKLGILPENNVYLRIPDGTVDNNLNTIGQLALQIRLFQPDLIITHNPENKIIRFSDGSNWINHRDHLNTGLTTVDAAYPYSRDLLFFPEHFQDPLAKSWNCSEFLFVDSYDHPESIFVDVTDSLPIRIAAHALHSSQYTMDQAQESAEFFTGSWDKSGAKKFETFRYCIAD
jgi:LmbE family N-acetylglucosaminyl deacetylase